MTTIDYLLIIIAIALIIGVLGVFKKFKIKKYKAGAVLLAIILCGVAWYGTSNIQLPEAEPGAITPTTTTCATFDITPAGTTVAVLNAEKTGFMCAGYANTTAHTLKQSDNSTSWASPVCTFGIVPVPPTGSFDVDTGCTIYYEVAPADISIDTSTGGTYKLFTQSGGNRQLIWVDGTKTEYVSGSKAMLLTNDTTSITLTFTVNQDSMSRIEDTYSPISVYVTFSNGCGWSEVYKVDFMLLGTYT